LRTGSAEFNLLSQAEKDAGRGGTLSTKIAEQDAIKRLVKDLGIPQHIAIAIVMNNTSFLQDKALDLSFETGSQYLKLAGLNTTESIKKENTQYKSTFFGLTIS
jgi:hypothetical protein